MRLLPRSLVVAAALIAPAALCTSACGDAGVPSAAARPAPSPVDAALARVVAAGSPGAIALVGDGHAVRVRAAGLADTERGRALRPGDRFRAGSITKSFVATVALQLVAEGRLSLDDTVERRLPGLLPYGERVTLRQLLNLTSGIPDNQDPVNAELLAGNMTRSWSHRELVELVADKPLEFAPGTSWAYSNTNYVLAGLMIERVTGHTLGRELERRIIAPLRLRSTSFPVNATTLPGSHAHGYAFLDGAPLDVTVLNPSGTWAAGNLVSSAADIGRFWRAVLGGRLLAPRQLRAMKTTVPSWEGTPFRYGLGIQEIPTPCGTMWGNGGDIAGFANVFQNTEDGTRQAALIVNANPAPEALGEQRAHALSAALSAALGGGQAC